MHKQHNPAQNQGGGSGDFAKMPALAPDTLAAKRIKRWDVPSLVAEKFRQRLPVPVGDPLTVEEFLENR